MVANSMVGSHLDYCNFFLHGTSAENLGKLQPVLNALVRMVSGTRRSDHITPVLAPRRDTNNFQDRPSNFQSDHDEKNLSISA